MSVPFCNGRPIPIEVLEYIAFILVAFTPVGNPSYLVPLLGTSKSINSALSLNSGTSLYSRICRLKYDIGAVTRRAFIPHTKDLTEHLVHMSRMMQAIKRGDIYHEDVDSFLMTAYMTMLEDDGKNRAQLEHAGIETFVNLVVRLRLNEGRENNRMWPVENMTNSCALWLMWMFTTKEKLEQETPAQREFLIQLILPFVLCPYRYACAFAPPNHFVLPLTNSDPVQNGLLTVQTAHGQYPVYHTLRHRPVIIQHFRSTPLFSAPLITAAAKLLFMSRREMMPFFRVPDTIPLNRAALNGRGGLTQEDLLDFNRSKAAKLPKIVRWDWDNGYAVTFSKDGKLVEHQVDASKDWDVDWWRHRSCGNVFWKQPNWKLGSVYVRGMLSGLWQGVYYLKNNTSLHQVLSRPEFPTGLSEASMVFMAQPILIRLREHGFVHTPIFEKNSPPSSMGLSGIEPGPIPHAPPRVVLVASRNADSQDNEVLVDGSMNNAWLPGPVGSLKWIENNQALADGMPRDPYLVNRNQKNCDVDVHIDSKRREQMSSTKFILPLESSDAYFGVGPSQEGYRGGTGGPVTHEGNHSGQKFVYETYEHGKYSVHQKLVEAKEEGITLQSWKHPGCRRCADREASLAERREKDLLLRSPRNGRERKVEEAFATVGMERKGDRGYIPSDGWVDNEYEEEEEEGDIIDLHLEDDGQDHEPNEVLHSATENQVDGEEHEHRCGEEVEEPRSASPSPASSDSDDDSESGYAGIRDSTGKVIYEATRRSHDRYRVENCQDGVEDAIITGDLDQRHRLGWGNNVYYGRVRPWDGMVAILRVSQDHNANVNANFILYGYIYGGNTFVGNWRYAGVDPLMPGFESCFVMSKRED